MKLKLILILKIGKNNKQFYEPKVEIPQDLLEWGDLSPRNLELAVAREIK